MADSRKTLRSSPTRKVGRAYLHARENILELVNTPGKLTDSLPSEREWQKILGISRSAVRQALVSLEFDGFVRRRGRSGWFRAPPPLRYDLSNYVPLSRNATSQGRLATWNVVTMANETAPLHVTTALGVRRNRKIPQVKLVHHLDGEPFGVEIDYVHPAICTDIGQIDHSKPVTDEYARLTGCAIIQKSSRIRWITFGHEFADLLGFNWDSPAVSIWRTKSTVDGDIVAFEEDYWHASSIEIVQENAAVRPA